MGLRGPPASMWIKQKERKEYAAYRPRAGLFRVGFVARRVRGLPVAAARRAVSRAEST
ncbi:hypothetical protein BCAR13_60048 [Paraburkholderia caribensis]|nr:hypothetical protein BCAR13_60048 [Paraburkholderia caribensis]